MHEKEIVSSALLYRDQADLKNFLKEQRRTAPPDCSWLVLIHTCCHSPASAVAIAQHVKEVLPDAAVLGTSAAAVIHHGSIYTDQCLLHITRFRRTRPEIFRLSLDGKTPEELAEEAAENFPADSRALFAFFTDQYMHMQPFLQHLEQLRQHIPAAGGMISANTFGAFSFDESGVYPHNAVFAVLCGTTLRTWSGVVQGQEAFGETYTITKTEQDSILEVDHQPASQWFQQKLEEICHTKPCPIRSELLMRFPLALQQVGTQSQFLSYSEPQNRIQTYSNWLPAGTRFRMAYLSPLTAVAELRECCAELNTTPCQTILAYPGTLHYSAMTNCTAWELRALRSSRICGAFLHGEIAAAEEHNQVYVGADTLFGLTESEHDYLPIDQTLLDDLQGLDADWHNIDQYLEHAQQQATISSASRQIM